MRERPLVQIRGRGAAENPPNRFEQLHVEPDPEQAGAWAPGPRTRFYRDVTRRIIADNESPDVGFTHTVNPYRGCEHGCVYCFARPFHEYLGMSAGLDFESRIMVKENAAELLRSELMSRRWTPAPIAFSGVTDPYQPIERRLRITRGCMEVLAEFRNPVAIVTKNHLVTRDRDLLSGLATAGAAAVFLSITTLDAELQRSMEPRASASARRLAALEELSAAGIPVGVLVAPVIPGLTDHEMPAILEASAAAGASFAGYVPLRLPHAVAELFSDWLQDRYPDRKEKVLNHVRGLRNGKLYDAKWGARMRGEGKYADHLRSLFEVASRKAGLNQRKLELSTASFRRPQTGRQLALFD
jgi:DNA repair photolyase